VGPFALEWDEEVGGEALLTLSLNPLSFGCEKHLSQVSAVHCSG
jgi:hypothetical protein